LHVPGGSYHVTLRGNHRHAIFARLGDRDRLDDIVGEAADRYRVTIHAYCWMTNHIHLLAAVADLPLGRLMQRVATRYARYFHGSFGVTGHLFERRYHALFVDRDSYLLELVRYIHLNPVRAGIVAHAGDYRWSSHNAYLGVAAPQWVSTASILGMLGSDPVSARSHYAQFALEGERSGLCLPLQRAPCGDPRVLQAPPALGPAPGDGPPRRRESALDELIEQICREEDCSRRELTSRSRESRLVDVRVRIAEEATALGLASMTEVARRLERTPAAISRALRRRLREPSSE
jgi:REP element-mobilizing transposase RayT